MEEMEESYWKSKKTKCNLLHRLCCCISKPEHHNKGDNDKTNMNLKIKKPKYKLWKSLRSWLSKPVESKPDVSCSKFDHFDNGGHRNNVISVINIDDEETPEIEGNDTAIKSTIDTNGDNFINTNDHKKSWIYQSIFEGNVTVHKTTIYNNEDNTETKNENIPCIKSLDTESEEKRIETFTYQTIPTDLITTSAAILTQASVSQNRIPLENTKCEIPKFYFPSGKRRSEQWDMIERKIREFFQTLPNAQASKIHFNQITKLCDLPFYLKKPLFIACVGKDKRTVKMNEYIKYWRDVWSNCSDISAIFVRVMSKSTKINVLTRDDFKILIQDVIDTHPSLIHLKSVPKYHSGYAQTVIASMFYDVNSSWSGKISVMEIRRSKLIAVINSLENEDTIKQLPSYFNYEQYFVIESIFWRLDRRKCSTIKLNDLNRYNRYAISKKMLKRIFSGTVIKREEHSDCDKTYMDYWDFVFFIRSEEDKNHSRAIEYWFRCMDIDGDGYLSLYELEYFYDEQLKRLKDMRLEGGSLPPFQEHISEILYMVNPKHCNKVSLTDLKSCKMSNLFFNTFFNIHKYLKYTECDPHDSLRERRNTNDKSDWEMFIEKEYRISKSADLKKNKYRRKNYKR